MTPDSILAGIKVVVREQLKIEREIEPSTEIIGDLQLDSLHQLTLVVELENHFKICFEPGSEAGITTVADVVDLIHTTLTS